MPCPLLSRTEVLKAVVCGLCGGGDCEQQGHRGDTISGWCLALGNKSFSDCYGHGRAMADSMRWSQVLF